MSTALLDQARATPGVAVAAPLLMIGTSVTKPGGGSEATTLVGFDLGAAGATVLLVARTRSRLEAVRRELLVDGFAGLPGLDAAAHFFGVQLQAGVGLVWLAAVPLAIPHHAAARDRDLLSILVLDLPGIGDDRPPAERERAR